MKKKIPLFVMMSLILCACGSEFPECDKFSEEQVKSYCEKAHQGTAAAQYNMGLVYKNGNGVPQSYTDAVRWFRKGVEQEYAGAQTQLGIMYFDGLGVPQSYTDALEWFRKAAKQGYAQGQYNLGYMHLSGKGVPKSVTKGVNWIRAAAKQGDPLAKQFLRTTGQ